MMIKYREPSNLYDAVGYAIVWLIANALVVAAIIMVAGLIHKWLGIFTTIGLIVYGLYKLSATKTKLEKETK